jgi:pyrroline-5-carboxylate reductase
VSAQRPAELANLTIVFVGAGKMGSALLSGLTSGAGGAKVLVLEPSPSPEAERICREKGFELRASASAQDAPADVLLLAVKPQALDAAAPAIAPLVGSKTLVVSILAGKRIADLAARLPAGAFVRAMPNTPAAIGRGVSGAYASEEASAEQRAIAQTLLSAGGAVEWVDDEKLIDAVTAVSGSGPAYVFYLTECLAAAGVAAGLPEELSMRLARATVSGAGELMRRSEQSSPAVLRENVTSPGGTTAAALAVLMADDGMGPLLQRAVEAARRRAGELSG